MNVKSHTVHLFQNVLDGRGCHLVDVREEDILFRRKLVTRQWIMCSLPRLPLKWIRRCCKRKISSSNMSFAMTPGGHPSSGELICCRIIVACSATYLAGRGQWHRYRVYQDETARTGHWVYQDEDAGSAIGTKMVHWEIRCGRYIVWLTCLTHYALAFSYKWKHFQWSKQRRGEHSHK
jgi:hypothetical protein